MSYPSKVNLDDQLTRPWYYGNAGDEWKIGEKKNDTHNMMTNDGIPGHSDR